MMKKRIAATMMVGFVVCSMAGCSTKTATRLPKKQHRQKQLLQSLRKQQQRQMQEPRKNM